MPADAPTILATSGGIREGWRTRYEFSALNDYAVDLSGVTGRAPRVCFLATAHGDDSAALRNLYDAAQLRGFTASHLALFPMPNVDDIEGLLLDQDVVWVGGGSVAGLLAMWRLHGVDAAMRTAWRAGVVLTGISAGSICWHSGGTTDSFGPELRPVTNGLALVPFSNGVHYDSEGQRRPLFQRLIGEGTLPPGYATDDGAGVLYRDTDFVEAVSEQRCLNIFRHFHPRRRRHRGHPRHPQTVNKSELVASPRRNCGEIVIPPEIAISPQSRATRNAQTSAYPRARRASRSPGWR